MSSNRQHAVVLGASIAGLTAARALADHYEQVTILERDAVAGATGPRRGVPQGRHVHALLTSGKRAIEMLFPGVTEELVAQGALAGTPADCTLVFSGVQMPKIDAGLDVLNASRTLLEDTLRARVVQLGNVVLADGCEVRGLVAATGTDRVTGVRVLRRADGSAEETLPADLVVDATGRGSRAPVWLAELGYEAPEEKSVTVQVSYTTAFYPRFGDDTEQQIITAPRAPDRRTGAAIAVEGNRYVVTLSGMAGEQAPTDRDGFLAYARSLARPEIHDLVRDREPLTDAVVMRYPANRRRHYERLERFPEGLVVCGDALCSFNPIYGQGMSVAALEAVTLSRCLADGDGQVTSRFYAAATPILDVAWGMASAADAKYDAEGTAPLPQRLISRYLDRLTERAGDDATVAAAFLRVMTMVDPPPSLLEPRIAARVAFGGVGDRLGGAVRRITGRTAPTAAPAPTDAPASADEAARTVRT